MNFASKNNPVPPAVANGTPVNIKCFNFEPAVNIIIDIIPTITNVALKWSCTKTNISIIGNNMINGIKNPVFHSDNLSLLFVKYTA